MPGRKQSQEDLDEHANWIGREPGFILTNGLVGQQPPPEGYNENYITVDVLGKEFLWMNDCFPKDKFTWYVWYESVFLVPKEKAAILIRRWGNYEREPDES